MNKIAVWDDLPSDLLVEIFSFLNRRDLLSCAQVSRKWKNALHCPRLWTHMVIRLDADLMGKRLLC